LEAELAQLRVYTVAISEDGQNGIIFLHQVVPGCAEHSFGVHVAKLAGMPQKIIRRAEMVLQQLETEKHPVAPSLPEQPALRVAEANGHYQVDGNQQTSHSFAWQSQEARQIAYRLEQSGQESVLDEVDVQAITPLDALNLLFLRQKMKKMLFR
jgi:DNA mismatch repair protein MutS